MNLRIIRKCRTTYAEEKEEKAYDMGTQEKWIKSLSEEIERENEKKLDPEECKYSPYDERKA